MESILIIAVSGLINLGCFYFGYKAGKREEIIPNVPPMEFNDEEEPPEENRRITYEFKE